MPVIHRFTHCRFGNGHHTSHSRYGADDVITTLRPDHQLSLTAAIVWNRERALRARIVAQKRRQGLDLNV